MAAGPDMLIHFIQAKDIEWLETKFATLTEAGWVIPDWVVLLRETMQGGCNDA